MGVFTRMLRAFADQGQDCKMIMIDSTFLKAHRTASSLRLTKGVERLIGLSRGGRTTTFHAVIDAKGRPTRILLTPGQIADSTGAKVLVKDLPKAGWFLADKGYGANWLRKSLKKLKIKPCIPGRKSRRAPIKYSKRRYKKRHRIENTLGRVKDWRRIAMRYDRCPTIFESAIALAVTVLFWL